MIKNEDGLKLDTILWDYFAFTPDLFTMMLNLVVVDFCCFNVWQR